MSYDHLVYSWHYNDFELMFPVNVSREEESKDFLYILLEWTQEVRL
jgi:hypothetical protein